MTEGIYYTVARRMSFPRIDADPRTNDNFRHPENASQMKHHKEYSIFQELPINMISDFPTSDPLHLLELGVMKKYE